MSESHPPAASPARLVRVRANQQTFHEVEFLPGFNMIVADRTDASAEKDTRNGIGKTTLIQIVNFCLGSRAKKREGLLVDALEEWAFTLDMTIAGEAISVRRSVAEPSKIYIDGDVTGWPISPGRPRGTNEQVYKLAEWTSLLGHFLYGIPVEGFTQKYSPTFRSLVSYVIRHGKDAYSSPFEHHRKQAEYDKQINNAFLLGLAWEDASTWQSLKDKKEALKGLRKAGSGDLMASVLQGSLGELEASKVRLEQQVGREGEALRTFKVNEQYRDIEARANELSRLISEAANTAVRCRQTLESYRTALEEADQVSVDELVALYQEANVIFSGQLRNTLDQAREFHEKLIGNRRRFLGSEIERLTREADSAEQRQKDLIEQRAELLGVLASSGALDQYTVLQKLHAEKVGQLEALKARIENLKRLEEGTSEARIEEESLKLKARNDLDDRREQLDRAIAIFNANSEVLYESPANLIVDLGPSGFRFNVEILRSESQGVGNMKILCYDLMIAEMWAKREHSPGFLIHDSTLFDGVDERQIARGLQLAARKADECGFQYICTINSDMIPWDQFSSGFDPSPYIRLRLTDKEPSGSLLGFRF